MTPPVKKQSVGDTGVPAMPSSLLALRSLARRFGLQLDAGRMLRDNRLGNQLLSPADLMRCAASAGLRATGLRPGWKGLSDLSKVLPAIVILKDGEAMILARVDRSPVGQVVVSTRSTC